MPCAYILLYQTVSRPTIPAFPDSVGSPTDTSYCSNADPKLLFYRFSQNSHCLLIYFPDGLVPVTIQVKEQREINAALNIINSSLLHP